MKPSCTRCSTKDLEDWHPREDMPVTQALYEQKAESADPLVHWLGDILEEGDAADHGA